MRFRFDVRPEHEILKMDYALEGTHKFKPVLLVYRNLFSTLLIIIFIIPGSLLPSEPIQLGWSHLIYISDIYFQKLDKREDPFLPLETFCQVSRIKLMEH